MTYTEASKKIGNRDSKKLCNNTYLVRRGSSFAIKLHNTDVVTISPGVYKLDSGGWLSKTTKDRINRFSPARILQVQGNWFHNETEYFDGMTIDDSGNVIR